MKTPSAQTNRCPLCPVLAGIIAAMPVLHAQTQHPTDGVPGAVEEEIRWLVNRARFDRNAENALRRTNYTDVPLTSGPLAPHYSLTMAARHHAEDCARLNAVGHETPAGSTYYTAKSTGVNRFIAEGYPSGMLGWAENWHAGTDHTTGRQAYLSWWISTGHRQNMGLAWLREIGSGHFYRATSTYKNYFVMGLAAIPGSACFTDTLFDDRNGNSTYEAVEGISGVKITLRIRGTEHGIFDVSVAVGSFAIPVQTIPSDTAADVWLTNQQATVVNLSIPRTATTLQKITLAAGESQAVGTMTQPSGGLSTGFRQLAPYVPPVPVPVPALTLTRDRSVSTLSWPSQTGLQYLLQWSSDLSSWADLGGYQTGSGAVMTGTGTTPGTARSRFYRLVIRRI